MKWTRSEWTHAPLLDHDPPVGNHWFRGKSEEMFESGFWFCPQMCLKRCVICPPCGSPGVDKENVQLSPSSALSSGGRTRHGSASQVQKQRSAGSFKRPSIKKIVWSAREHLAHPPPPPPPPLGPSPSLSGLMLHSTFYSFYSPSSSWLLLWQENKWLCVLHLGGILARANFFSNLSFETAGGGGGAAVESVLFSSGVHV